MHIMQYLGGQTHTEAAGRTWHITSEVKKLQEISKDWYGSNDEPEEQTTPLICMQM